jgi:hypothetical protein
MLLIYNLIHGLRVSLSSDVGLEKYQETTTTKSTQPLSSWTSRKRMKAEKCQHF